MGKWATIKKGQTVASINYNVGLQFGQSSTQIKDNTL